jgi:RNA polymerase sigma-70 factor (ECF subfamily)
MAEAEDALVMAALAAGSEDALGLVYDRLAVAVRAIGWRIVGDAAADDVVQDTFERVWRNAARFDPRRGSLEAWVLRIARNSALGHLRRTRPHLHLDVVEPVDVADEPADVSERWHVNAAVRGAVAQLRPERRAAVEQVMAGHTLVQTADRLGLPEGTVKSRVRAAYAELRVSLAAVWTV